MTMPAGKYYVGDLCYVMHDCWNEVVDLFYPTSDTQKGLDGEFVLRDGRRFASFDTLYGDGSYRSSIGTRHCVDSGSIGCISVYDIRDQTYSPARLQKLGAIVDFEAPFEVSVDQGLIRFGSVEIATAGDSDFGDE